MAFRVNSFALLDDEESDDVSKILTRVAAKHVASSQPCATEKKPINQNGQKETPKNSSAKLQFNSKPLPRSDQYVRVERGRGRGGRAANDPGRYSESEQSQNNKNRSWENSSQRVNGHSNGYRQGNGQADGVQRYNSQRANGYNQENRQSNGNMPEKKQADGGNEQTDTDGFQVYYRRKNSGGSKINGSQQGQGARGGGRGRGCNGENGFRYDNRGQVNKQVNGEGQNGGSGGSQEKVNEENFCKDESGSTNRIGRSGGERGNNGNYRASRNQEASSFARRGRMSNGKTAEVKISETKNQLDVEGDRKDNTNVDTSAERNGALASEATIDAESNQEKCRNVASRDHSRNRGEEDEEKNKMTLEEYEKQLLEKRKKLEALKTEERKVVLDKDFESMKLVDKKKEYGLFIKPNSEKDQVKKDSSTKDEKVRKAMSISQFLKPAKGEFYKRRGGRNQGDDGGDGGGLSSCLAKVDDDSPNFEDSRQFPSLPASTRR